MPTDLVIFDCDGVLIDSEIIACQVDSVCLAELGIAITPEEIMDRYVGQSLSLMLRDLEDRHDVKFDPGFPSLLRNRVLHAFAKDLRATPGVAAAIDAIGIDRCVASSSDPERLRFTLSLTGLLGRFAPHIFSAVQVERGKPAPDLFLFAANRMGHDCSRVVVVEDSVSGVEAAVAAGMRVLGFTGGGHCRQGHAERLTAMGAQHTFACMDELPGLL